MFMKIYISITLFSLLLFSCSSENDRWEWVIEESGRVVIEYIDTLESSVGNAKDVKKLIERNNNNLDEILKEIPR